MNMDSEFSRKRDMKLKKLTEIVDKIQVLHDGNTKVHELEASLAEEEQLMKEQKQLLELLEQSKQQEKNNMETALKLQTKLAELQKLDDCVNDLQQNLMNTYNLLGFHVRDNDKATDHASQEITLAYNKEPNFFVTLKHTHNTMELLQMHPPHPLMSSIQEYLLATQDVRNFLEMVERFFYIFKQSDGQKVDFLQ